MDLSKNGFMKARHSYLCFAAMQIPRVRVAPGCLVPVWKRRIPFSRLENKEGQDAIEDSACQSTCNR